MKKELSSIELRFLIKELQGIINAKIDQIYPPAKESLLLQLHVPGKGKKLLKITLPSFIYLSKEKYQMPAKITDFVTFLRETINNARIREINQIQNERIIEIKLEKNKKYSLIIELFSKGNIILCQNENILMAFWAHTWKNRTIKKGQKYIAPINKYNLFSRESLTNAIKNSQETISKTLAVLLRTGKTYAEELCLCSGIDKLSKNISNEEIERLYSEVQKLANRPPNPRIIYENNEVLDIVPVDLRIYKKYEQKEFKTYNDALASVLDKQIETTQKAKALQRFTRKLERIETKIQKQKETLIKLETEAEENQRKGELIYENYQEINRKLEQSNKHQKVKVNIK
ncbi:NFACT family protein [Candidatus Woesearchaeota archaeon]|nr:NFACT family protein [Candidatus Woesearchaeota archaeon]